MPETQDEATAVLKDALTTADHDVQALYDRCEKGTAGLHDELLMVQHNWLHAIGAGRLQTERGCKQLLTATVKQLAGTASAVNLIKSEITAWERTTQAGLGVTPSKLITYLEKTAERISQICRVSNQNDRVPTTSKCMDVLESALDAPVRAEVIGLLTRIDHLQRDKFTYAKFKERVLHAEKILAEQDPAWEQRKQNPAPNHPIRPPPKPAATPPTDPTDAKNYDLTQVLQRKRLCIYNVVGRCQKPPSDCDYCHDSLESVGLNPADFVNYMPSTKHLSKRHNNDNRSPPLPPDPFKPPAGQPPEPLLQVPDPPGGSAVRALFATPALIKHPRMTCSRCGSSGHMTRECNTPCQNCQAPGHTTNDCPEHAKMDIPKNPWKTPKVWE